MKSLTIFLFCCVAAGQEQPAEELELNLILSTGVYSEYILKSGIVFHEEPVVQSEAVILMPRGFYAGVWWSVGLNDTKLSSDFADEVDWFVGWSGNLSERLTLDIGAAYFDLVPLGSQGGDGDVVKPYASLSYSLHSGEKHELSAVLACEWHEPLKDMSSGVYAWAGLQDSWRISPRVGLDSEVGLLYDSGAYDFEPSFAVYASAELNWQVSERISLQLPSIQATNRFGDGGTDVAGGPGLSINF